MTCRYYLDHFMRLNIRLQARMNHYPKLEEAAIAPNRLIA